MAKSFKLFCLMLILLGINYTFGNTTFTSTTYTYTSTYTPTSATNSTAGYSSGTDSESGKSKNIFYIFIWIIVGLFMLGLVIGDVAAEAIGDVAAEIAKDTFSTAPFSITTATEPKAEDQV